MEKYLRLLNPKSTNFDGVSGCSHGALTTADVCVAMSYMRLTPIQDQLFQCFARNQNTVANLKVAAKSIQAEYSKRNANESNADHEVSLFIALVELCAVPADYKPSERNRAVIGGVSRMQVQRKLGKLIDNFKTDLREEIEAIETKLIKQIKTNI